MKILENTLWQYIKKEHLSDTISDKKWQEFVNEWGDTFADECSNIARELFLNSDFAYNNEQHKESEEE